MAISIQIKLEVFMDQLGITSRDYLIFKHAPDFDDLNEDDQLDAYREWLGKFDLALERALYRSLNAVLSYFYLKVDYISVDDALADSDVYIMPDGYDWMDVIACMADAYIYGSDEHDPGHEGADLAYIWWWSDCSIPDTAKKLFENDKVDFSELVLSFDDLFKEEFRKTR